MNTQLNTVGRQSWKLTPFISATAVCLLYCTGAQAGDNCYFNWAMQWDSQENYDKAIADYTRSLECCPDDATAYNNRGYDWYAKGDYDKAIADYTQALAICPRDGAVYSNRGVAWDAKGDLDKALADYNEALAIDPTVASAYNDRGCIESSRGEYEKAKDDFYRSLSADPHYIPGLENLGFFLATCPDAKYRDGKKAFENASLAYQLDNGADPYSSHNALAAVYAECGDFAKAQDWQQKTVDLAPQKDKSFQTARLELFKQKQPYRSKQYTELAH